MSHVSLPRPEPHRRLINGVARGRGVARLVELSSPVVEAGVYDAGAGTALVLANFTYQPVAELNDVELRLVGEAPAEIAAEEANLRHVVRNLVDNAIKFSPPKSQVDVSLRIAGQWAILDVRDQGEGISPEDLPRLFGRFFRGDKARHRSTGRTGTGLGLSISRDLARLLGGELRVRSILGRGTTFTLALPITPPSNVAGNASGRIAPDGSER